MQIGRENGRLETPPKPAQEWCTVQTHSHTVSNIPSSNTTMSSSNYQDSDDEEVRKIMDVPNNYSSLSDRDQYREQVLLLKRTQKLEGMLAKLKASEKEVEDLKVEKEGLKEYADAAMLLSVVEPRQPKQQLRKRMSDGLMKDQNPAEDIRTNRESTFKCLTSPCVL